MSDTHTTEALDLAPIKARHEAAREGPWRWYGNTDRDVYLATVHGGRVFVLNQSVEFECDVDNCVNEHCDHRNVRPILRFQKGGWMQDAREFAVPEVDYRTDIATIEHPDAEFIAHARADVPALIAEVERLRETIHRAIGDVHALTDDQEVEGALSGAGHPESGIVARLEDSLPPDSASDEHTNVRSNNG